MILKDLSGQTAEIAVQGPNSADLAVASGAGIEELAEPTLNETVWEAALAVNRSPIHLARRG